MGLKLVVLDPTPNCPASSVAPQTVGSFRNRDDIRCAFLGWAGTVTTPAQMCSLGLGLKQLPPPPSKVPTPWQLAL